MKFLNIKRAAPSSAAPRKEEEQDDLERKRNRKTAKDIYRNNLDKIRGSVGWVKDYLRQTPLHYGSLNSHTDVVRYFLGRDNDSSPRRTRDREIPLRQEGGAADWKKRWAEIYLESAGEERKEDDPEYLDNSETLSSFTMLSTSATVQGDADTTGTASAQNISDLMRLWYNRALQDGDEKPRRIRLMMSGPFGAGKTSVLRSLQGEPFQSSYESTEGIVVGGTVDNQQLGPKLTFERAFMEWYNLRDEAEEQESGEGGVLLQDAIERDMKSLFDSSNCGHPSGREYHSLYLVAVFMMGMEAIRTILMGSQKQHLVTVFVNLDCATVVYTTVLGFLCLVLLVPFSRIWSRNATGGLTTAKDRKEYAISMSVWDFAGQIEYHSMHQMFFRPNCIYLLVLDLQTDDMDRRSSVENMLLDAQKWLNAIISSAGTDIGLIVVGTHADLFDTWEQAENRLQELFSILGTRVTDAEWDEVLIHAPTFVVDNKNGCGISNLRRALQDLASTLLDQMENIPLRWLRLLEELETTSLKSKQFCVALDFIEEKANKIGFIERDEVVSALSYLDQTGNVVYMTSPTLREWVFPQPQLLLNAMRPLLASPSAKRRRLTRDEQMLEREGCLTTEGLKTLWTKNGFQNQQQLRELLSALGLIMNFEHGVVVPSRLPDNEESSSVRDGEFELVVETKFSKHMPPSMFPFVLATCHHKHGMKTSQQDLSMVSRTCCFLALDVSTGTKNCHNILRYDFRARLWVEQLRSSIFISLLAAPRSDEDCKLSGETESKVSIQKCVAEMCKSLFQTVHLAVKQRFRELSVSSWVRTGQGNQAYKWCFLKTEAPQDSSPLLFETSTSRYAIKHNLHDACVPAGKTQKLSSPASDTAVLAPAPTDDLFTMMVRNGKEQDVGELEHISIRDPNAVFSVVLDKPSIFLAHRGPDTKEQIVRPTDWFLSNVLKVDSFFDGKLPPGEDKMLSLIKPAHICNHALVLLSPRFRESKYCLKELNTFMVRHYKGTLKLIPALWQIEDVKGYARALNNIVWRKNISSDPAEYMVAELWPLLVKTFKSSDSDGQLLFDRADLVGHLIEYVKQIPDGREVPDELVEFVTRNS